MIRHVIVLSPAQLLVILQEYGLLVNEKLPTDWIQSLFTTPPPTRNPAESMP